MITAPALLSGHCCLDRFWAVATVRVCLCVCGCVSVCAHISLVTFCEGLGPLFKLPWRIKEYPPPPLPYHPACIFYLQRMFCLFTLLSHSYKWKKGISFLSLAFSWIAFLLGWGGGRGDRGVCDQRGGVCVCVWQSAIRQTGESYFLFSGSELSARRPLSTAHTHTHTYTDTHTYHQGIAWQNGFY